MCWRSRSKTDFSDLYFLWGQNTLGGTQLFWGLKLLKIVKQCNQAYFFSALTCYVAWSSWSSKRWVNTSISRAEAALSESFTEELESDWTPMSEEVPVLPHGKATDSCLEVLFCLKQRSGSFGELSIHVSRSFSADTSSVLGAGGWMSIACLFVTSGIEHSTGEITGGLGEGPEVPKCLGLWVGPWGEGGDRYLLVEGLSAPLALSLELFLESSMLILSEAVISTGSCLMGTFWLGEVRNGFVVLPFGDVTVTILWWWCCCGL